MSQEPTYPADAVPGRPAPPAKEATPVPARVTETPDLADTATAWKKAADAVGARPWQTAGVAIGIGSAAVAAALLYANRGRKN